MNNHIIGYRKRQFQYKAIFQHAHVITENWADVQKTNSIVVTDWERYLA